MNFLWSAMSKDLARWREDAAAILLWLAIPLIIGTLITSLMGGEGGAKPTGLLLIADLDESLLSGLVAGAYSQGELGELISVEQVTLAEGTERINKGDASGLLIVPEGFADALLESEPVTLTLTTNPSQVILPGIITDVTEILLDAGFSVFSVNRVLRSARRPDRSSPTRTRHPLRASCRNGHRPMSGRRSAG